MARQHLKCRTCANGVAGSIPRAVALSDREHYVPSGYCEHRRPSSILINEEWYIDPISRCGRGRRRGFTNPVKRIASWLSFAMGASLYANTWGLFCDYRPVANMPGSSFIRQLLVLGREDNL